MQEQNRAQLTASSMPMQMQPSVRAQLSLHFFQECTEASSHPGTWWANDARLLALDLTLEEGCYPEVCYLILPHVQNLGASEQAHCLSIEAAPQAQKLMWLCLLCFERRDLRAVLLFLWHLSSFVTGGIQAPATQVVCLCHIMLCKRQEEESTQHRLCQY